MYTGLVVVPDATLPAGQVQYARREGSYVCERDHQREEPLELAGKCVQSLFALPGLPTSTVILHTLSTLTTVLFSVTNNYWEAVFVSQLVHINILQLFSI